MIYDNVDPSLLDFLNNPMLVLEHPLKKPQRVTWQSRLLYRVPALRQLISAGQVQGLIGEKLEAGLVKSRKELPHFLFEDGMPLNEKNMHRFTDTLREYFNIDIALNRSDVETDERKALIYSFIRNYTWARLEYTCNRVAESLQLRAVHNLSILGHSRLWTSYYLSEQYFLIAQGLMTARLKGKALFIMPTKKLQDRIKGHWLAEMMEADSKLRDSRVLLEYALILQKKGQLPLEMRELLIAFTMDKCLSIHVDYLSEDLANHPVFKRLKEVVYFAVHLELRAIVGKRSTPETELQNCVSAETVHWINSALSGLTPTLDSASSFVEYKGGHYIRDALSFKYGLKKFVGFLIANPTKPHKGKDFGQVLGMGFEVDYIKNYIRDINDPRFEVHGEFKPGNNAQMKDYDIDLVLHDREDDIYYFIQVKYLMSDFPIYLSEQCRLFTRAQFKKGFLQQLGVLKNNLDDDSIRRKLASKGLSGATAHNSHFVLLHNLPFLNFYELDGVFFYEWNLLRNILRRGRTQYWKDDTIIEAQVLDKPRLHRPKEIIDAYFNSAQGGTQYAEHYDIYSRAVARFKYDGLNVICKLV
nr:hypothetical protein [Pseudomonas syringae]